MFVEAFWNSEITQSLWEIWNRKKVLGARMKRAKTEQREELLSDQTRNIHQPRQSRSFKTTRISRPRTHRVPLVQSAGCCCCCCCLHIIHHPGLSTQYLLLSQPLRTNPTLDSADFRGHRLTYQEKVYQIKWTPKGQQGDKIQIQRESEQIVEPAAPLYTLCEVKKNKTKPKYNTKLLR